MGYNFNTQANIRLHKKADGSIVTMTGQDYVNSLVPVANSSVFNELVVAADTTTKTAPLTTVPSPALAYLAAGDSFDGALSGESSVFATTAALGTADVAGLVDVGGQALNVTSLLDADGNEVLLADGTEVKVVLQTLLTTAGDTLTIANSQVTFVTVDKDGVYTPIDIVAGTYGYQTATMYSDGHAKNSGIPVGGFSGGSIGDDNRDEVAKLIAASSPTAISLAVTTDIEVANGLVVVTLNGATGAATMAKSDATAIVTAAEVSEADAKTFNNELGGDTAGLGYKDGIQVFLNGNLIGLKKITGSATGATIAIDLNQTLNGYNWLVNGDVLDVQYRAGV